MSDTSLSLLVTKLNNHVALNEADRQALLDLPHTFRELGAASYIIREGEVPSGCPVLLQGFAYRHKVAVDGGRSIVAVHIPGEPLDLQQLFLDRADHNVQAANAVRLAIIPRPALREIAMARPTIGHAFSVNNQIEASILREWLLNVGRRDARARIAHLLCEVAARLEQQQLVGEYGYELPMTQEQLGDATGLTAVHVNRTLKSLESDGLVTRNKRTIFFPDPAALQQVAGFVPLYLHLGHQAAA